MKNLKEETLQIMKNHGKSMDDVIWVGCEDFAIPMEDFWKLADTTYDSGFGAAEVAQDLIVVGEDWWLERHEYDGSEWWEYKVVLSKPEVTRNVSTVIPDLWRKLETCVVKATTE